jgi:hypothetical protein
MTTVLLAVLVFILAVLGLALGVVLGRRSIKGSCGGCVDCICKDKRT